MKGGKFELSLAVAWVIVNEIEQTPTATKRQKKVMASLAILNAMERLEAEIARRLEVVSAN